MICPGCTEEVGALVNGLCKNCFEPAEEYKIVEEKPKTPPLQGTPIILLGSPFKQLEKTEASDKQIKLMADITMCDVVVKLDDTRMYLNSVMEHIYSNENMDELNKVCAENAAALINEYDSVPKVITLCANLLYALEQVYIGKISCKEIEKCQLKSTSTELVQEIPDQQE